MTDEAARIAALLACGLTAAVIYRHRHATSDVARLAAGLAGGACFLLLISSGVLSFAPHGAARMLGNGAAVGLALYALLQRTARQVANGTFLLLAWLASLLPRTSPLLPPLLIGIAGMFVWFQLRAFRGSA